MKREQLIKIIDDAINREDDSYIFYKEAAEKCKDPQTQNIFKRLSKEELKHKEYLSDFLEKGAKEIKIKETDDYKLAEDLDEVKMSVEMDFKDALQIAIKREEEAMNMYKDIALSCVDESEMKIFEGLSKMEQMHKTELEEMFLNVGFNEVW